MVWLFFLILVLAMVWLALLVQRRRRDQREAEQAREMAFLLAHGNGPAPDATQAADRALPTSLPAGDLPHVRPVAVEASRVAESRPPYLNPAQAAAFRRLAAALPGYLIFPRASLRRAAGLATIERDVLLDFVICTPALQPVAAVDLIREGGAASADALKRDTLQRAGVGYAAWRRGALPEAAVIAAWLADQVNAA